MALQPPLTTEVQARLLSQDVFKLESWLCQFSVTPASCVCFSFLVSGGNHDPPHEVLGWTESHASSICCPTAPRSSVTTCSAKTELSPRYLLPTGTMLCLVSKGHQTDVAGKHGFAVGSVAPGPQAVQLPVRGARPLQSMVASGTQWPPSPRVPSKLSLQTASVEIPLHRDYPSGLEGGFPRSASSDACHTVSRAHTLPNRSGGFLWRRCFSHG